MTGDVVEPKVRVIEGKIRCKECFDFPGDKEKRQGCGQCTRAHRFVYAMDYICELFKKGDTDGIQ